MPQGIGIPDLTQPSVSDSDLSQLDPYETLKLHALLGNRGGYTPEQAAQNRQQTILDMLYASPLGNAFSARDALESRWRGQQLEAQGDIEGARQAYAQSAANLGMAFLPGMGRIGLGQAANQVAREGKDVLPAIMAWHGSPHDFDRFSMEHIGKGEGAQVYGHGMYFAENPETAKYYREALSQVPASKRVPTKDFTEDQLRQLAASEPDKTRAENFLHYADQMKEGKSFADVVKSSPEPPLTYTFGDIFQRPGGLYKVDLDVEPHQLLDWDKPLSEQGDIGRKAASILPPTSNVPEGADILDYRGHWRPTDLIDIAKEKGLTRADVSNALREAGIPGIKYLDQGSRGVSGNPTHNYVMFDENLIKMLGKE